MLTIWDVSYLILPFRAGWDSWIRTSGMRESKSRALPLGDIPLEASRSGETPGGMRPHWRYVQIDAKHLNALTCHDSAFARACHRLYTKLNTSCIILGSSILPNDEVKRPRTPHRHPRHPQARAWLSLSSS